jgi:hypothetical protein
MNLQGQFNIVLLLTIGSQMSMGEKNMQPDWDLSHGPWNTVTQLTSDYSLPKIKPLKLDNAYFGSTKQISKNLIVDPRDTYCTGITRFDYLDLIK